ncbi:hypothetical protein AA958_03730 [Streptomyces sp. CNQ-509]|uniref:hypothetical protein n=1 Tax=unclassified Streptomyces TaxID=2593676 RepID=UPI00062DE731|nr:hypothetical protein [Streptomyces sp. CNQ-509]AKH81446.1 hypothetical protein AA958_03730 [Streptomyces sp. CNQ-509]
MNPTTANVVTPAPARLERRGRLPWPDARALLAGTTCAWADLDGFHVAPAADLPGPAPLATHLWAWDDGGARCSRLRFDGAQALVAVLHVGDTDGGLQVRVRPGRPWDEHDHRVGPLRPEAYGLDFELLELTGPTPATFVRAVTRI